MDDSKNHVFIIGMHRSGTSFLSRAFNLCGVYLGPESDFSDTELKPTGGNPKGHWENVNVMSLNEDILKENGGSWDSVPKNLNKTAKDLESRIKQILTSFYSKNALAYGFKDPRFPITFEKWIPYMKNFVVVGIFRHPLKVAESLKIRDGLSYADSLNLWKEHNEKLLQYIKKYNGFLLDFDWAQSKLLKETQLVASKLGLAEVDLSEWYSDSLKKSDKSYNESYPLDHEIKRLYEELKHLSKKNSSVRYKLPKKNSREYDMIISDLIKSLNRDYFKMISFNDLKYAAESPLIPLVSLYYERNDLQESFPEVKKGNFVKLIGWANKILSTQGKNELAAKKRLKIYSQWYAQLTDDYNNEQKEKISLQNEANQLQTELAKQKDEANQLQTELAKQKDEANQLQTELAKQKDEANQLQTELALAKQKDEANQLQTELAKQKESIESLTIELSATKNEIDSIKSSRGFKALRFVGTKIDKVRGKKKIIKDIKTTVSASKQTIEEEGFGSFVTHAKQRVKRGEFLLQASKYDTTPLLLDTEPELTATHKEELHENILLPKFNISIIIPTKSDESSLRYLIDNINLQKGLKNLEIVLINSGQNDLQTLEKLSNVKCTNIDSKEFGHGKTRNLGLEKSKHEYVFFLTEDAIPANDHLFYDMCEAFQKDDKIAAVTVRQIPRSDADLMAIFSLNEFYEYLGLKNDRIITTRDFDGLDSKGKRAVSQIDDVCACYKRKILSKYRFHEVKTGEDLELGVRLVKDGHKIAQIFSTGVIHSHKRSASYYFKRGFVETQTFSSLLSHPSFDFKKFGIRKVEDLIDHILSSYWALNHMVDYLKQENINDFEQILEIIQKKMPKFYSADLIPKYSDKSLDEIFKKLNSNTKRTIRDSFLLEGYLVSIKQFMNFLKKNYPNLSGLEDDFYESLYKKFGLICGNRLGSFCLNNTNSSNEKNFEKISKILESGV